MLISKAIDSPERRPSRAVAEVTRPAAQYPVQHVAYVPSRIVIAGNQELANLRLEPLYAFLRWACAQIPFAVRLVVDTQREATTDEVILLRRENDDLKKLLAETFLKYEQFKKSPGGSA